jgi:uncharacterized membrane protein
LLASGSYRRGALGSWIGGAGALLFARSATNLEVLRIFGVKGGRRLLEYQKTIHVDAPVENVFRFFSEFRNFPKFMTEVVESRVLSEKRSHWTVYGPLNTPVSFDAEVTALVPSELIAWRSVPGSLVRNAGQVKFAPKEGRGTKVELKFTYNPPAGMIGHGLARLLGFNPKQRIAESLAQIKQLIENGPSSRQLKAG